MHKKILLVTNFYSIFDKPIHEVFEFLGFEVQAIDYRGNKILMPGKFIHRIVAKLPAFIKYPLLNLAQWHVDLKILAKAKSYKPDLIFVLKAKDIHISVLEKLRAIGKVANYYPESFDHWNRIKMIAPHYDYFFNCDPEIVRRLRKIGCNNGYYLPFSADIGSDAVPPDFNQKKYAISFVGSFMPIRYTQRETILSQIKDLDLHIWGNKAWLDTSLKDCYRGRPSDEKMLDIYRQSKIVVNIDLMKGVKGTGVNLRPFEVTSCGAMLLNHDDRKDIFNLFEDGKEFVSFKGPEDIRQKVERYLNHEDELKTIAQAGFEKTKREHTYARRIQEALKIMGL